MNWKHYIIEKNRRNKFGIIDIIYTSIDKNPNIKSRTERLFVIIEGKKIPYRIYDLVEYKNFKNCVEVIHFNI